MSQIDDLRKRGAELDAILAAREKLVDREFRRLFDWNTSPVGRDGDRFLRACLKKAEEAGGPAPLKELWALFDELCDFFLTAAPGGRRAARGMAGKNRALLQRLQHYIGRASERLRRTRNERWLRRGLAAAAIENNRSDFRDTYLALGDLCVAADRAGIETRPHFAAVAALSTEEMRTFLRSFHRTTFYRSDVLPRLGKGSKKSKP